MSGFEARPGRDDGMVLLNVLIIVALTSAIVTVMVLARDLETRRTLRFSQAAQAQALIHGGETSVITALRRDAIAAPFADHLGEPWAKAVMQRETRIDAGRMSLSLSDGQALFNLNSLASGAPDQMALWRRIAAASGLSRDETDRVARLVQAGGPLSDPAQLEAAGLGAGRRARLADTVTLLPGATTINLNTAPGPLLALLIESAPKAKALVERRRRQGVLVLQDLRAVDAPLPPHAGFTSDTYWVTTTVVVGDTRQATRSLLRRNDKLVSVVRREAVQ